MIEECNLLDAFAQGVVSRGNPYHSAILLCSGAAAATFLISSLSQNYSQVDKLWSILPVVYAWIAVVDSRTLLMALVVTIWGFRLTWNFNRRGGYEWPPWRGDEDYRWAEIKKGQFIALLKHPVCWMIFNFGFISVYQNAVLLLIAAPSFVAYTIATECEARPLGLIDYTAALLVVSFVVIESIADNQQFTFQTEKYAKKKQDEKLTGEYADGFSQSGLFAVVRKPNYAAEQAIWISYYVFTIGATDGRVWNWSAMGCIVLCSLFAVSSWFTEKITRQKYPLYDEYMQRVPLFVPSPLLKKKKVP